MNKIQVGIMPTEQFNQRMIDIAAGRLKPKRSDPKIWFASMESLAKVLSDNNRQLLKIIAESKPANMTELAELSGRQLSNLSRTLKMFESYGLIKIQITAKEKRPMARLASFNIQIPA